VPANELSDALQDHYRKERVIGDKESWEDKMRRIEALFRFGAALPARDGFDEALHREWRAPRDRTSARPIYGCFPQLHTLTPRDLRLLAEANVRAQAEDAAQGKTWRKLSTRKTGTLSNCSRARHGAHSIRTSPDDDVIHVEDGLAFDRSEERFGQALSQH
jgi:hypothetical protein